MKNKPIPSHPSAPQGSSESSSVNVEVVAKPTRRRFLATYKLRILAELDATTAIGEKGTILRREGLYSSHICDWRAARRRGALRALEKRRGRPPKKSHVSEKRIAQLERALAHSQEELRKAMLILEVQGKVAGLLGLNFDNGKTS